MGGVALSPQPTGNLVGDLPQLIIGLVNHHSCIRVGSQIHTGFVHFHNQDDGLGVTDGGILKNPFLGDGGKANFVRPGQTGKFTQFGQCLSVNLFFCR